MAKYTYGMRNRPAIEAAPAGWAAGDTHPDFPHGTVVYDRELAPSEMYRYEMVLLDPLPSLPLYPVGSKIKYLPTGKMYEVEFWDGEYWLRDDPMPVDPSYKAVRRWHEFELVG